MLFEMIPLIFSLPARHRGRTGFALCCLQEGLTIDKEKRRLVQIRIAFHQTSSYNSHSSKHLASKFSVTQKLVMFL